MPDSPYVEGVWPLKLKRAIPKSEQTPVVVERDNKKKAKQKLLEDAYREVEKRDHGRSRVTGARLVGSSVDAKQRWEHNHIKKRSTYPSLRAAVKNIHLCSKFEHDLITAGWIGIEGSDANGFLAFHWNDEIAKGRRPLIIKRWNPRAEQVHPTGHRGEP